MLFDIVGNCSIRINGGAPAFQAGIESVQSRYAARYMEERKAGVLIGFENRDVGDELTWGIVPLFLRQIKYVS